MQSCAWMNGQYQPVGPPLQSSPAATQPTHITVENQLARTANNSYQYTNKGVRPPQSADFIGRDGAFANRQTSNWPTPAVSQKAGFSQQPAGGDKESYLKTVFRIRQNTFTNTQSGNPLVTNGVQVATQQGFHSDSGFINSSTQSPPNTMKANPIYPQQDKPVHWNQQGIDHGKQSVWTQDVNVSDPWKMKNLFQNVNGESAKLATYNTTATALRHEQMVYTTTKLVTATEHNRQTAHNQCHRQNGTQHGFSSSFPPPSYDMAVSHVSSVSQKTQFPINPNSTNNSREEATHRLVSQTNEFPLKPAADAHEEVMRRNVITMIADDLQRSFTARSKDCHPVFPSSPCRLEHHVSKVRMTESNQNMQPVTSSVTGNNSNAFQSLLPNSGLSLSKSTHSVMPRTQQSNVPNVFHVTATGDSCRERRQPNDGGGETMAFFFPSNRISKGNRGETPLLKKLLVTTAPEGNTTKLSVANNHELLSSVKENDGSIHSSPGHTGTRAIAVVQPLSQESYLDGSKHPSSDLNDLLADKSGIACSAASSDGTSVSCSDSAGQQYLSQKQLCADDTGSLLAVNMQVDQHVAPTAQQSVTSEVSVCQSGDKAKNEKQPDPKIFELSSIPTIPWTIESLTKLIQYEEAAQMKLSRDSTTLNSASKFLIMFWDGDIKKLSCQLRRGWYKDIITYVTGFCSRHVTLDSVILSQVNHSFEKRLQSYHVLKDNEVYSERPYRSSWLNVNEQLDDIDKEFGFPWSLNYRSHTLERHSMPDQVLTVNSIPAQIVKDVPNKVLSQPERDTGDSGEEKQTPTAEATSTKTTSPKAESVDSSDSFYSFEIQVLPPEEAKVIFEQIQSQMPQSMDTDNKPESVGDSSVEGELPEAMDVTLNNSKLENETVCPIEQVCCIARWMEIIGGSNTALLSKCQCRDEPSLKDCTENTSDQEEMEVQKEDNLRVIMSGSIFHMEGDNQVTDGEDNNTQIVGQSEPCSELSQTSALTDNDHKCHSYSDKEPKNISQISINSSQSSMMPLNENEDEDLTGSGTEAQSVPDMQSTGSTQPCASVSNDKEIENLLYSGGEVASQISAAEENCGEALLASTDVAESSFEAEEEQTQIIVTATTFSLSGECETIERKRKRLNSPPVDSQPSTCREASIDATDSESLASNGRSVQLVLFGSATQGKSILIGDRKRHISSPGDASDEVPRPPEVVSVKLSPLKRKSSETLPMREHSVKRWIHEKWRRSVPPTTTRHKSKLKTQKCTFASLSGMSLKRAETVGHTNTVKLPVSYEMRRWNWNRNAKRCLSLKRRRSLSDRLKQREKTEKDAVALKRPADQERSDAENGGHAVMPLQENNVLKFNVLPNTFNFKDGSNEGTSDPFPDNPASVKGEDKSVNKTVMRGIGPWCPNPEKKYCPLRKLPVPKTSNLFQEFQKKYMEKTQPATDAEVSLATEDNL